MATFPLQTNFYVKQIIGCRRGFNWSGVYELDELLSSDFKDRIYICYQGR